MTKKKHRSEPRVFDGRIIHSDEMERIHKESPEFKSEAVSKQMRELIEVKDLIGGEVTAVARKVR